MRKLVALSLFALSVGPQAMASTPKTADQLTCAQVIHEVRTTGRYYEASADGPLPIVINPSPKPGETFQCTGKDRVWREILRTLDTDECEVGYVCTRT